MTIEQEIDALVAEAGASAWSGNSAKGFEMLSRCWRAERKLREAQNPKLSPEDCDRLHAEAEAIVRGLA